MADYNISLGVTVDTSGIQEKINSAKVNPIKINIDLANVDSQINKIKSKIQSLSSIKVNLGVGTGGGRSGINDMNWAYRQMLDIQKRTNSLSLKMNGLDTSKNVNELKELSLQFARLKSDYQTLMNTFGNQLNPIQFGNLQAGLDETSAKLSVMDAKIADTKAKLAQEIRVKLEAGDFSSQVQKIESDASKLSTVSVGVRNGINSINQALTSMKTAASNGDINGLIKANQDYERALKAVNNQIRINARAEKDAAAQQKLVDDRMAFRSKIDAWLTKNSAATKQFGSAMLNLKAQAESCDRVTLNHLKAQFDQLNNKAGAAGLKMQSFGDKIKTQFQKYSQYLSVYTVIMYATRALRDMFNQVKAIDSAMTELKKVTNESDATYDQFLSTAASRAKTIGTTIDGLVSSTADFARLGYDFKSAQGLAEVANIYAVVGDEVNGVEGATESLISTMAAFKGEMDGMSDSDFAMSIIDKFNEIGNNFAISSGGIGEALERSASSLYAANNTLDESIALITAANTVVQDPDAVGTAFKTISMRIRGAKTELEDAGLETDGMVESTAKLREEILALSGVDIMDNANEFKSTYQIMDELAQKWQDLTDIQQASITELIAGKRQGNIVSSLMSNFDVARDALQTSINSSGSAMEEHAKWSESLEARLNKLKATWQSFSQSFMSSGLLKSGLDSVTGLVDALDGLVKNFGILGATGAITGIINIIKNLKGFKYLRLFGALPNELKSFKGLLLGLGQDLKSFIKTPAGIASTIGLVTAAIALLYNQYKKAKEEAAAARRETIESSDEYLEAASSFKQAYVKYSGRTDLTVEEEAELTSAIQGTVNALNDKSSALQGAVDSSNDYVASLENIARAELKASEKKASEKVEAAEGELKEAAMPDFGISVVDVGVERGTEAAKIIEEMDSEFFEYDTKNRKTLSSFMLPADADIDTIIDYYDTLVEYKDRLSDADLADSDIYKDVDKAIGKLSEVVATYTDGTYDLVEAQYQLQNGIPKTTEEYLKMREAILGSEEIKGMSFDSRTMIANSLDSEYGKIFDLTSAEVQARKFIGLIKGYGDGTSDGTNEIGTVETFLNMRTMVNNNECTVGEYLSQFDEINKMTENWSDEEKDLLNTSLGLDMDSVKQQYDDMYRYISRNYTDKYIQGISSNAQLLALKRGTLTEGEYIEKQRGLKNEDIEEFLNSLTAEELSALVKIRTEIDWETGDFEKSLDKIQEQVKIDRALSFNANIAIDKEALDLFNDALNESASASGLSSEAMDSLMKKYSELEGYNPATLFERTANGIKVNRDELADLEKEYNNLTKGEIKEHLDTLVGEYNKLTKEIDDSNNAAERARLIAEREGYGSKIQELAAYQAQLEGLTGAYQRWINAQNSTEDYEGYEAVAKSRESIQDEIDRGFIGNATKEYIDLLSGEDLVGGTIDDYAAAWKRLSENVGSTGYSIHDFFTLDDEGNITATGIDRFFEGMRKDFEGSVAKFNKDTGEWTYDFSKENLQKIQDEWGVGVEAIQLLLEAAGSAGYDVDWDGILDNIDLDTSDFETLVSTAEAAQKAFNKLEGVEDVDFNFTATGVEEATSEVEKARNAYVDLITNDDGSINLKAEGAEEMRLILATLLIQKQQLEDSDIAINIDTSKLDESQADIGAAIDAIANFREKYKNLEIAVSTGQGIEEAKTALNTAMGELQGLGDEGIDIAAKLILGEGASAEDLQSKIDSAIGTVEGDITVGFNLDESSIGSLNTQLLANFTPEATVKITGIDDSLVEGYTSTEKTVDGTVKWNNDDSLVVAFQNTNHEASGTVKWTNNTVNVKTSFEAKGTINWDDGESPAAGTAHSNGSTFANGTVDKTGRTFARGDWSIGGNGVALGGELGQELVVRDGRFFTIGDNGAEFFRYKKNDIVFNAAQTESLFKYGGIKGANPRGKMLASGSAFAEGNAFAAPTFTLEENDTKYAPLTISADKTNNGEVKLKIDINWESDIGESDFVKDRDNETPKPSSPVGNPSDSAKEAKETIDWIETAIDRIERAIDELDTKANSVYRSWSERNKNLVDEIGKVGEEINLQQAAYERYLKEAESVGLDAAYAEKVRNGEIDIEGLNDEDLIKKIEEYKEWYFNNAHMFSNKYVNLA